VNEKSLSNKGENIFIRTNERKSNRNYKRGRTTEKYSEIERRQ
jgi:hypothetical protein